MPLAIAAVILSTPHVAGAYAIESAISEPCHERITFDALHQYREEAGNEWTGSEDRDEKALIRDAPFPTFHGMDDLGAVTLALANRHVDLDGHEPDDLDQVAVVHGNPNNQAKHCLRDPQDDGEEGTSSALEACKAEILSRFEAALAGLDEEGGVDVDRRTTIEIYLEIRRTVEARLPTYYVEMGQALHTLQDAFSHQLRGDTHTEVHTVLNYVEYAEKELDEAGDGPAHSSDLDLCTDLDSLREERLSVATQASYELLSASLSPGQSAQEKRAAAEAVLAKYLTHRDGCTLENDWCGAEDAEYPPDAGGGCNLAGANANRPTQTAVILSFCALLLGSLLVRARRSRATSSPPAPREARQTSYIRLKSDVRRLRPIAVVPLIGASVSSITPARAADAEVSAADAYVSQAQEPDEIRKENPWGVYLAASGAVQNPAAAATLGLRYRLGERVLIGLNGEFNPLIAQSSGSIRLGVANAYGSFIWRNPMRAERVALRTSLHLGTSTLLFDLYGAPRGSTGIFAGVNLLGLDYELHRQLYVVLDPANIAIVAPQLRGAPFVYPQYRVTLGLQWGS